MTDAGLDALLHETLPECDAGEFSVALMEAIASERARPARILSWIMAAVLTVIVAAACVWGALAADRFANPIAMPAALLLLTLALSFSVLRSARA